MVKKNYTKIIITFLLLLLNYPGAEAQQVTIGTGTTLSVFSPICRSRDYSVYEIIYLNTEIGMSGNITDLAFYRSDGTDVDPIENVSLFMKHTTDAQLTSGNYSENGYQLVYQGVWPNDVGDGWREVSFSSPFVYDSTNNLQVLVLKGFQTAAANTPVAPRWTYTSNSTGSNRARRYYDNTAVDSTTMLTTINFNANVRLNFGSVGLTEITNENVIVFPNPAQDKLFVNVGNNALAGVIEFSLYDHLGRMVHSEDLRINSSVELGNYSRGIYFYTLRMNNELRSGKVILN